MKDENDFIYSSNHRCLYTALDRRHIFDECSEYFAHHINIGYIARWCFNADLLASELVNKCLNVGPFDTRARK